MYLVTAYYTPNDGFTTNDESFYVYKSIFNQSCTLLLKSLRGTIVLLYEYVGKQKKKEKNYGLKISVKINYKYGWVCKKYRNGAEMKMQEDYPATEKL